MSIAYQEQYTHFIREQGVGANDSVASSVASYLSYLHSVGRHLGIEISPSTLHSENDVQNLAHELDGIIKPKTIRNYVSAMRQYIAMIEALNLSRQERQSEQSCLEGKLKNPDDKHFLHSSFREKLLEHLFVAELLKRSWQEHSCDLEIAKPEVDSKGYDLIVENKGIVRHIQLKSTKRGGNAAAQNIHSALALKPSGCVVWLEFDELTLELGPFRFLGGAPGARLPSLADYSIAKHTKANSEGKKAERLLLRTVKKSNFELVGTMDELYIVLFG
ncbi:hypothetical protein L9G15_14475 [Shewanella sp. A3A]|nr:hypothetical protein [Shewanella ferrihydritica]